MSYLVHKLLQLKLINVSIASYGDNSHSTRYEEMTYWILIFSFLIITFDKHFFIFLLLIYVIFREMSVQIFCSFYNQAISFPAVDLFTSLSCLVYSSIIIRIVCKYFFPFTKSYFVLTDLFSCCVDGLSLVWSSLTAFVKYTFDVLQKRKSLLSPMSRLFSWPEYLHTEEWN